MSVSKSRYASRNVNNTKASQQIGQLALVLDHRGRVVTEHWADSKPEMLDWLAEHAEGLPMIRVRLVDEPEANPRFSSRLASRGVRP